MTEQVNDPNLDPKNTDYKSARTERAYEYEPDDDTLTATLESTGLDTKWIMLGITLMFFVFVAGVSSCIYGHYRLCEQAMQSGNQVSIVVNCRNVN